MSTACRWAWTFLVMVLGAICLGDATELAQQVLYRQIRRGAAMGQTMPFRIGHWPLAQALAEFIEQPRLADAGLAREAGA